MKRVRGTNAGNKLIVLIHRVRVRLVYLLTGRVQPVAQLVPATDELGLEGRLARLVRKGIVVPARKRLVRRLWADMLPRPKGHMSASAVLLEERRDGR